MVKNELEKGIITTLRKHYPLDIEKFIGRVSAGYLGNNFIVASKNKKYFLRFYRDKYPQERIESMQRIEFFLAKNNIPVIVPLKAKNGKTLLKYQSKFLALFPYVKKSYLKEKDKNAKTIKNFAQMLAKIHLLSKKMPKGLTNFETKPWIKEEALKIGQRALKILLNKKNKDDFDRIAQKFILFRLKLIKENKLTFDGIGLKKDHLIHGDYHAHNVFIGQNKEITHIFDFEMAVLAPRSMELARAIELICLGGLKKKGFKLAKVFFEAYNQLYPISKEEFKKGVMIQYLRSLHTFWIDEIHYFDKSTRCDCFYKSDFQKLKYFSENLNNYVDRITSP